MRSRRLLAALTLVALALGGIAGTGAAGSVTTRFVDDDGEAGPGGCGGTATAVKKIQKAIDASSAGDTIIVCPGEYRGDMVVPADKDGLTIIGARAWTARIRRTAGTPAPVGLANPTMLHIVHGANGVRVQHLVFIVKVPALLPTGGECGVFAAIWVEGRDAEIRANRIRATGATWQRCGLYNGIVVGPRIENGIGAASPAGEPPASALVSHNAVRDFMHTGIAAVGGATTADIHRNSIRYWHLGFTFNRDPITRAAARQGIAQIGRGTGIEAYLAVADVYGNEISSGPDAGLLAGGVVTPSLAQGILVLSGVGSSVRQNTIQRTTSGIVVSSADRTLVKANVVSDHYYGIELIRSDLGRVQENQVTQGYIGISLVGDLTASSDESDGNRILDNTSFSHTQYDCLDQSSGDGTAGTDNIWRRNTGLLDSPDGICDVD